MSGRGHQLGVESPWVLAPDVKFVDPDTIPSVRDGKNQDAYKVVVRPRGRFAGRVIDRVAYALLSMFETPTCPADAIIYVAREVGRDPSDVAEEAFTFLRRFRRDGVLLIANVAASSDVGALQCGAVYDGMLVKRAIQDLDDCSVYQVVTKDGADGALKLAHDTVAARQLKHERFSLQDTGGVGPTPLEYGEINGQPYLVTTWIAGTSVARTARTISGGAERHRLHRLVDQVLLAYARLHSVGVLHGDVHPRNVLATYDGDVKLIDFGLAACRGVASPARGGVLAFYAPEVAAASLKGEPFPSPNASAEQFSVAALCYLLLAGATYISFPPFADDAMRKILEKTPRRFAAVGALASPGVEAVLTRALSHHSECRYSTLWELREDFQRVVGLKPTRRAGETCVGRIVSSSRLRLENELLRADLDPWGAAGLEVSASGPSCSIKFGASGIAWALLSLACARDEPRLLTQADKWCNWAHTLSGTGLWHSSDAGINTETVGTNSLLHGDAGLSLVTGIVRHARADGLGASGAFDAFLKCCLRDTINSDATIGRAGLLAGCSLLAELTESVEPSWWSNFGVSPPAVKPVGGMLATQLLEVIRGWPVLYTQLKAPGAGFAHGAAGILHSLIRWCRSIHRPIFAEVVQRLDELQEAAIATPDGMRWPVEGRGDTGFYASWCNGVAGCVLLWVEAYKATDNERYLDVALRVERELWSLRFDVNYHSLCCGAAGAAYAFGAVHEATRSERYLQRAHYFLERGGRNPTEKYKWSLFKGQLGLSLAACELAAHPVAPFPLYGGLATT